MAKPVRSVVSRGNIFGAAFLGGAFAGAWLVARNYSVMDEPSKAKRVVVMTFVFMTLLLTANAVFMRLSHSWILPIAAGIAALFASIYNSDQKERIELAHDHLNHPWMHWWTAFGIALLGFIVQVVLFVVILAALSSLGIHVYHSTELKSDKPLAARTKLGINVYPTKIHRIAPRQEVLHINQSGEGTIMPTFHDGPFQSPNGLPHSTNGGQSRL